MVSPPSFTYWNYGAILVLKYWHLRKSQLQFFHLYQSVSKKLIVDIKRGK